MKIRISLLVACLAIMGFARPIDAEITKNASLSQASTTRVKKLEAILRGSGLCKHYPNVVKILDNNTAEVATYVDRRLSDRETKLLALKIAKFISTNVDNISEVKVRFYDRASIKYWKDIVLSQAQIQDGLKSGPEQEQILDSIKIVNNLGLVDGPNLEYRVEVYNQILKLKHARVDVRLYLAKLGQIEKAEKNKQSIDAQLTELNASLAKVESEINKPVSSAIKGDEEEVPSKEDWQEAYDHETAALKAVEDAEQEQNDLALPEAWDNDARARYADRYQGFQQKIDSLLAAWHEAVRFRELTYEQLTKAKVHY